MKKYKMLQTVRGSRDGINVETFARGETYEIDESLAEQFCHQGAVEEVEGDSDASAAEGAASAPNLPEGARDRSTKVIGPQETKVVAPAETKAGEAGVDLDTQHIEELVAVARDHYGLDVNSTMSPDAVQALIEEARSKGAESDTNAEASKVKKAAETKTTGKKSK